MALLSDARRKPQLFLPSQSRVTHTNTGLFAILGSAFFELVLQFRGDQTEKEPVSWGGIEGIHVFGGVSEASKRSREAAHFAADPHSRCAPRGQAVAPQAPEEPEASARLAAAVQGQPRSRLPAASAGRAGARKSGHPNGGEFTLRLGLS